MVGGGNFVEIMGLTPGGREINGKLGGALGGMTSKKVCLWQH